MNLNEWNARASNTIQMGSELVQRHMGFMKEMVRIDSRSFNVNEFEGDRTTPTDMKEILELAQDLSAKHRIPHDPHQRPTSRP